MAKSSKLDFAAIRRGLASLPRTSHHAPGATVAPDEIVVVPNHRAALDPDRTLVVGNRGVGKSFWTSVLASQASLAHVAGTFRELEAVDAVIGFDASDRVHPIAPTESAIRQTLADGNDEDTLWRTVMVRAAKEHGVPPDRGFPAGPFSKQASWVRDHGELADAMITALDDRYTKQRRKLVLIFDALDRLGADWQSMRKQVSALLKRALAARSYRSIRFKLFMRRDQVEDPLLFQFADGSKISNERVELLWSPAELYDLLFSRLAREPASAEAFAQLQRSLFGKGAVDPNDGHKALVNAIAGEFMGSTHKRGRVFTWIPLHLSDARGEASPRTFLTAWREAALHEPAPAGRALDHLGIQKGVSKASGDRLEELSEDYSWIQRALHPLGGQQVPMERSALRNLWSKHKTAQEILTRAEKESKLPPVRLSNARSSNDSLEEALILDLEAIGIVEVRPNDKINVPDIFRLAAGIKRKGGVPATKQAQRS
jgi:hypothetical protein